MTDLVLVRPRNHPLPGVAKNSDSGAFSGRRIAPFGIMNIAAYCRQQGHEVKVMDLYSPEYFDTPLEQVADEIASHQPKMVGISSITSQAQDAMALGDLLMERSDAKVVHGGVHPATTPTEALKHGHYVVQGDGEHTMHELLVSEGKSAEELPWADRPSIRQDSAALAMAKDKLKILDPGDSRVIPGKLLPAEDMAAIPFPERAQFEETALDPSLMDEFRVMTARGCPYRCVFCKDGFGLRQSSVRYYPVDYVADYFEYLHKEYGVNRIGIIDDIFVSTLGRMEDLAIAMEKRKLKLRLGCMVHANTVKQKHINVMHRLGLDRIFIGIESGNDEIHKLINKGTNTARVEGAVHMLRKNGFYTAGMFMIGNIGETVETIKQTIRFAFKLPLDQTWFSFAAPYPGTPFYDKVAEYGEILEPDFGRWNQMSLVYRPKDVSVEEMYRLMRWAQAVRVYKKARHTMIGTWEVPLRRALSGNSRLRRLPPPVHSGA